jgi:DNA (cytosine-5)-methyltransferase 1
MLEQRPRVIDLFAGVGGLSLGASRAGFNVAAAVEIDKNAVAAHKLNFPTVRHVGIDVGKLAPDSLLEQSGLGAGELVGLIGGPPCQGFSSMGRRDAEDPRNSLFSAFFRLARELRPAFFLAENVPGILDERNEKLRNEALAQVPNDYVLLEPIIAKANAYGAPTTRTRVFFIGYDPTRINPLSKEDFVPDDKIEDIRVGNALQGIPELGATWESDEGWLVLPEPDDSHYGSRLKAQIPPGVGHPDALKKYQTERLVSGFNPTAHTASTVSRFESLMIGKADKVSKSSRLDPNGYCPTLRAGTGPEKGSYQAVRPVHPTSPRVICPREAARLQGFPDWFQFDKTKWHAFRQIGNSVSPIVAEEILRVIYRALKNK